MSLNRRRRNILAGLVGLMGAGAAASCDGPAAPPTDPVAEILAGLSTQQRAALTIVAGVRPLGDSIPERLRAELNTGAAAAVTVAAADLLAATEALQAIGRGTWGPLMVMVEVGEAPAVGGGRNGGLAVAGDSAAAGREMDEGARAAAGEALGRWVFAGGGDLVVAGLPTLNRTDPFAVTRDPRHQEAALSEYLTGLRRGGVATAVRALAPPDSSPEPLRWDLARLRAIELPALDSILQTEVPAVVLGSARLPSITGDSVVLPASPSGVRGLLRRDLGFDGVVMADLSPESPMVAARGVGEAAIAALNAGVDVLVGVEEPAVVADLLVAAAEGGRLPPTRLAEAAGRMLRLRREIGIADSLRAARRVEAGARRLAGRGGRAGESYAFMPLADAPEAAPKGDIADSVSAAAVEDAAGAPAGGEMVPPAAPILRVVDPDSAHMNASLGSRIDALMRAALEDSVFSGAAVAVGRRGGLVLLRGYGRTGLEGGGAEVDPRRSVFDIASLSKVVGTTTAVALLVDEGRMELDAPLRRYLPGFEGEGKADVRIRHLLTHTSGLPSGLWIFGSAGSPQEALQQILEQPLLRPPGERMEYSDLGMILLAVAAERAAGMPLERYLAGRVFAPLGMEATMYLPPLALHPNIVPTAGLTERDFPLKGVVHDANAFRLGGVAGHAGLFSTARDLAVFAQMMLNGGSYGTLRIVSPATVAEFTRRQPGAEQRALGWDTPSRVSSAGDYFSARSFGHTGYTGTSLWIDPASGIFVVLLTNRTYTRASAREILRLRAAVHDAAARAVTDMRVRRRGN